MRRGEILGLQWRDLDCERGVVSQRRTIVKEADVPVVKEGSKTGRGRVIELTDLLAGVLEGQRERMATRALLASGKLADDGFVFSFDPIGATPARPDWITKLLGRWSKRNGVRVHPHGFRHTFISGALLSGIDLVRVSAVAGQSKAATTFRYAHVISPSTDAVDAVAALVRRAS